ncbi:MAG: hypothetical protein ABSB32_09740 [Thermodesulfobacteriota bacterium]
MKPEWYGDKRDLVKWGVLLHIARDHSAKRILQVAYLRPSEWPELKIDGQPRPIPEVVIGHFRNVLDIARLSVSPQIEVVGLEFVDRRQYTQAVIEAIASRSDGESCVVFLDPDTGLEPGKATFKHVLVSELAEIWHHMLPRDVLVFYQHQTRRNGQPWIEPKREQFENALGLVRCGVKVATGHAIARDVAFFYCHK